MIYLPKAVRDVIDERARQDAMFGPVEQETTSPARMMVVLGEEFGEACQALLAQKPTDKDDLRAELIQVAAVATKMVEMGDCQGWW